MMPNSNRRDGFFYLHFILVRDTYTVMLIHTIKRLILGLVITVKWYTSDSNSNSVNVVFASLLNRGQVLKEIFCYLWNNNFQSQNLMVPCSIN